MSIILVGYTIEQLTALNNALALGVKKVKYGDKETEYQSIADMMALRDAMINELQGVTSMEDRRKMAIFRSTNNRT